MKIFIATHKDQSFLQNSIFVPIQVGTEKADKIIDSSYFLDNTGADNISAKNVNYNELSALYWMWKNMQKEDIVGLMHYRRFFHVFRKSHKVKHKVIKHINDDDKLIDKMNTSEKKAKTKIKRWLKKNDIILPYPRTYKVDGEKATIAEDYCHGHIASDWEKAMAIVIDKYPEYETSIENHLYNNYKQFYMANMFIAPYSWLNDYCKWLFDILFELENQIEISEDPYQRRVFGFMSERLLSLYIHHNKFKAKHLPLLFIEGF